MNGKKEYLYFPLGDFLTNAGLVGLSKLLNLADKDKKYHFYTKDQINVDKNYFLELDLTQAYFDTLIREFEEDNSFYEVLETIDKTIYQLDSDKNNIKNLKNDIKFIKTKLLVNSYKNGYESIKEIIPGDYNLFEELKKIDDKDNEADILAKLKALKEFLEIDIIRETFFIKNIAYTIINNFWENKSFLNRSNAKKNMKEIYQKDFEEPLKKFLMDESKKKDYCVECGESISSTQKVAFTFMKDTGDDFKRKRSAFWNFKVNAFICPKCAFIYTLVPLGFKKLGFDFIFINNNYDIKTLIKNNDSSKAKDFINDNNKKYYEIFNYLIKEKIDDKRKQLINFQVITRSFKDNRYLFNIIGDETLKIIEECTNELQKLMGKGNVKIGDSYINIYQKIMFNILNHLDLYGVANELSLHSLKKGNEYLKWYIYYIVSIQLKINAKKRMLLEKKGENKMKKESKYWYIMRNGKKLRDEILGQTVDDSATLGVSYKMLNALKQGDTHQFMDIIMRLYNSVRLQVPTDFSYVFNSKEDFKDIGYAFLLGFRGTFYDKKDDGFEVNNNLKEEEKNE